MYEKDKIAGAVEIDMRGTFAGYVQIMFVREKYRGKNLGGALLDFAEDRIFKESPNAFLLVSSFNKNAIKFYEHKGFTAVGELKNFVVSGRSEILMRKYIAPIDEFFPEE